MTEYKEIIITNISNECITCLIWFSVSSLWEGGMTSLGLSLKEAIIWHFLQGSKSRFTSNLNCYEAMNNTDFDPFFPLVDETLLTLVILFNNCQFWWHFYGIWFMWNTYLGIVVLIVFLCTLQIIIRFWYSPLESVSDFELFTLHKLANPPALSWTMSCLLFWNGLYR